MNATDQDFSRWEEIAKKYTNEQLEYAIADCRQAAGAMATLPSPNKANYYLDQAHTFQDELNRREHKKNVIFVAMVPCVDNANAYYPCAASATRGRVKKYIREIEDLGCPKGSYITDMALL